ncbi:MAG TPA: GMC family oxidoreductase [Gammaproteobacteria bacterium]|nr:GMC family oxidoreductase [Gammaproteobacteria bacterium]
MSEPIEESCDVCIIGSGAGGGPVALTLARAGHSVVVLEKGPWFTEKDFYKDELACCRRSVYTPKLSEEQHVIEDTDSNGDWVAEATSESGWDFWNGNCVGGSSNFMSGFFYRLKPEDFRLRTEFGQIEGANIADWPISYDDMEPYYTRVEKAVGISGHFIDHPFAEPRSSKDFPYPPTREHPVSRLIDETCQRMGLHSLPTPRAVLSRDKGQRRSCEYSGFCGSYGCSSGAKGSSRAALLDQAVATKNCEIKPLCKVYKLSSDATGKVVSADYYDAEGNKKSIRARLFVVACQAIETSRLLLSSTGPKHPQGLANNSGQVGKNLLFSAGGSGNGDFNYADMDVAAAAAMKTRGPFVNRGLQDWYFIDDAAMGGRVKGGTVDFLLRHPNAMNKAMAAKWDGDDLVWGKALQKNLKSIFTDGQTLRYEIFCDWLPTDNCSVSLDRSVKDRWGSPVAKVRIGYHEHDLKVGNYINGHVSEVFKKMGASNIRSNVSGSPPQNLVAGGCRFGHDPKTSVLDANCRAHDVENLYVTDGSFMPTGGSVPYTWTIYANAFRVAEHMKDVL